MANYITSSISEAVVISGIYMVFWYFVKKNLTPPEILLSKPASETALEATVNKTFANNHEFTHLTDKTGCTTINESPSVLPVHSFALPWLQKIKREINKIKQGHSGINAHAIINNTEFLAVISDFFFYRPEKIKTRHPELYNYLLNIFHQHQDNYYENSES